MANGPFLDPETGLKRQREQRPEGEGERFARYAFGPWEMYKCLADGCQYDTQWSDQFDVHFYQKHIVPELQQRSLEDAAARARDRAERMKQRPDSIPILKRF